jgi:hypothetical protein
MFSSVCFAGDPPATNTETNIQDLNNELEQTKVLLGYCQNESEYWESVHQNDTINVSNQYLIETKNNISYINQQIIQINQTIVNIENKVEIICFAVVITFAITLVETLISISIYFKKKKQKKHEK